METALARLELVEVQRSRLDSPGLRERTRFVPQLQEPLTQLDFVVDGVSVLHRVLSLDLPMPYGLAGFSFVSVADLAWPEFSALSLRQLAGAARDPDWDLLEAGRLPLYGCSECGDLYCGALTVAIQRKADPSHRRDVVTWTALRFEDGATPANEMPDLSPVGSFTFDAAEYDSTLGAAVGHMEDLARSEHQAQAAWKARRSLSARLLRFLPSSAR